MKASKGRKVVTRRLVDREMDAIDRIDAILWELAIAKNWRASRRALFYLLLMHWPTLGKTVNPVELVEP